MRIDFHSHTYTSKDSLNDPARIVAACQRAGIDCLAVTDHNNINGAYAVQRLAPFRVIIGEEIYTTAGEIIGLFLSEEIPKGLSPQETVARIKAQGGLVYLPHPVDRLRQGALLPAAREAIWDQIDIVEVFNARCLFPGDNDRALALARQRGAVMGAGSDAHTLGEFGSTYVEVAGTPADRLDPADLLARLRQGRVVGHLASPLVHVPTTFVKPYKRLRRWLGLEV